MTGILSGAGGGHILEKKKYRPAPDTSQEEKVAFLILVPESEAVRLQTLANSEGKTIQQLLSIRVQSAGVRACSVKHSPLQ